MIVRCSLSLFFTAWSYAERGIATACRLSARDVEVSWSHRVGIIRK